MLKGKNAVVTGANRGIGWAITKILAQNHANVWCLDRIFDDTFEERAGSLEKDNSVWIRPVTVDLGERAAIKDAVTKLLADKGTLDILINNAGINHHGTFLMTSLEEMERLYQVNYYAPIQLIQLISKRMIRQHGGVIVNICSVSGMEHNVGNFAYGATKASLVWATRTISRELAPYHIRVNGISPGVTDTSINSGNEAAIQETVLPRMNIKRSGTPDEIARAVLFLASDESSFISGQILRVDGGRF